MHSVECSLLRIIALILQMADLERELLSLSKPDAKQVHSVIEQFHQQVIKNLM